MSTAPIATPTLFTAEQFAAVLTRAIPRSSFEGGSCRCPMPKPRHGQICGRAYYLLLRSHRLCREPWPFALQRHRCDHRVRSRHGPEALKFPSTVTRAYQRALCPTDIWTFPTRPGRRSSVTERPLAEGPCKGRRISRCGQYRRPREILTIQRRLAAR